MYSIVKKENTNEYHIFKTFIENSGEYEIDEDSICGKCSNQEEIEVNAICKGESRARKLAAEIGSPVCGVCVSHLYSTY